MMLIGENSREVVNAVKAAVDQIGPSLPKGVTIVPFYDRTDLVNNTLNTVSGTCSDFG